MSEEKRNPKQPLRRCSILGHGYCWAEHPQTHVRCCEPKGHPPRDGGGGHVYPYTPRTEW